MNKVPEQLLSTKILLLRKNVKGLAKLLKIEVVKQLLQSNSM